MSCRLRRTSIKSSKMHIETSAIPFQFCSAIIKALDFILTSTYMAYKSCDAKTSQKTKVLSENRIINGFMPRLVAASCPVCLLSAQIIKGELSSKPYWKVHQQFIFIGGSECNRA